MQGEMLPERVPGWAGSEVIAMFAVLLEAMALLHPADARFVIVTVVVPAFNNERVLNAAVPAVDTVKVALAAVAVFEPDRL